MSGAGRSSAAAVLDDLGFYVIDNLPTSLLPTIVDLASQPGSVINRLALVSGRNFADLLPELARLRAGGHSVRLLFLDASTAVLVQRYDATRRKHPHAGETGGVLEAIEFERKAFEQIRGQADLIIDTSELNVHQLKERVLRAFESADPQQLQVAIESFGYKNGLPLDADIVMDVRFLPNPHWDEELRPLKGHDPRVRDFVLKQEISSTFLDSLESLLLNTLPSFRAEGRSYLTIAIGCTGGRHRSVAVAEELARRFASQGIAAKTTHRDVDLAN